MILVNRNMVSVSDCSTLTSGALGLGQDGERRAEQQRKDGYLEDLIFGHGLGNVFWKDVDQYLLPALRVCGRRDGLHGGGERHACAGLGQVNGNRAQDQAESSHHFKQDDRLERHAAHAAQLVVAGDAGDDAAKDERGDDHADEAEKDFTQEVGLAGDAGRVHAQLRAGEHGQKRPHQQRTAAQGKRDRQRERGAAEDERDGSRKRRSRQTGRECQGCRGGQDNGEGVGLTEASVRGVFGHGSAFKVRGLPGAMSSSRSLASKSSMLQNWAWRQALSLMRKPAQGLSIPSWCRKSCCRPELIPRPARCFWRRSRSHTSRHP